MTTVIKPKRSEVALSVPLASSLEIGEMAVNVTDGKMYVKSSGNIIKEIGGAGSVTLQGATTAGNVTTNNIILNGSDLVFEGQIENAFETTLTVAEPTGDRTIYLPNQNGTIAMVDDALALSIVFGG
jgi:hypothetical protein